ncbi:putative RNA-directed DNA polymerase, eukaryota, reverse transcriptase zinc-binding domain protein [Tanacetum coccineum]
MKQKFKKLKVFKIDFEKAYDSLCWEYLDYVMMQFGFGSRWRDWIREYLSSARLSIMINGSPTDKISMYRGLRQGDPLSPFLLIFVMEELHLSIQKVVKDKRITRASVGENNINISHLFFADDVVFLSEWNAREVDGILHVLNDFHTQSGLKINIGKSNLYGVGTNTQDVRNMARASGCADGSLSFSYLVLQRFRNRLSNVSPTELGYLSNVLILGGGGCAFEYGTIDVSFF